MSTKINEAYKLKRPQDLWKVSHFFYKKGTEKIKEHIEYIFISVVNRIDETSDDYKKTYKEILDSEYIKSKGNKYKKFVAKTKIADKLIIEGYKEVSNKKMFDEFNFDCSITFREYNGGIYIIPYHCGNVLSFLKKNRNLFDFHYQNQTDRPNYISYKEWNHRREVWDEIFKNWNDMLVMEICSLDKYWLLNPCRKPGFLESFL
jgi:hypothetical protein